VNCYSEKETSSRHSATGSCNTVYAQFIFNHQVSESYLTRQLNSAGSWKCISMHKFLIEATSAFVFSTRFDQNIVIVESTRGSQTCNGI
jgi:hypothetical protein